MITDWFETRDPRFGALILGNVHVEKLWTGARWAEGPVYVPAGKYLLFSDIPNDRVMRFDETDGSMSVFESPAASRTATRSIPRAGWSPASMAGGGCRGASTMARSPPSPTAWTASG